MNYFFLTLLSLYMAQDYSVDVYLPQSESGDTEIYITTPKKDVRITYDSTDMLRDGYYTGTAYINIEKGSSKKDEATVTVTTSFGDDYVENSVTASNGHESVAAGSGGTFSYNQTNGESTATTETYVTVNEGRKSETYSIEVNHTQSPSGNETVYVTSVEADAGNVHYEEVEVGVVNSNGSGASVSVFEVSQASQVSWSVSSLVETLIALAATLVLLGLIYQMWTTEKIKRYQAVVSPIDASSDYIRI